MGLISALCFQAMYEELYDNLWYIDSGCSRHMTGKREHLRDYREIDGAGFVRFGNNDIAEIRGYGMEVVHPAKQSN